jgi:hypothetical protein
MPKIKTFKIARTTERTGSTSYLEGTLKELIRKYSYTLEVGESWQNEKGNKKINRNPRGIKSLVSNLNNAVNNSAANGYAGITYRLVETKNSVLNV